MKTLIQRWCFFLPFLLVACANVDEEEGGLAQTAMKEAVAAEYQMPVPEAVQAALLANPSGVNSARSKVETRFDVSVNQVPARTFFLSLVADAGVNVVAHPEVSGRISLELRNVSVEEVLNVTREVYGYEYKFGQGIYTIYPRKLRTEIFPINYLDVKRVGVTDTNVQIGKITSSSSGGSGGRGGNNNSRGGSSSNGEDQANLLGYLGEESQGGNAGSAQGMTPGARVQTLTKTDFWSGLGETIQAIIGDEAGRMVMTNPQAGLVVVKALPRELRDVREFLERSELSVKRQVILETKILEVRLNDDFKAGINWGAIGGAIALSQTDTSTDSLADLLGDGQSQTESIVSSVLDITDISSLLSLLERQGNVQVLSSPRISTVNNQKAVIRVGSDEFFVTGVSNSASNVAGSTNVLNAPQVELDSFFSGIALDVTPQIGQDGEVILHIHPIVTEITDQTKEVNVAGELFSLPLALREVRESDSIVKAKNGQVVVLGGLMQETTSEVDTKRAFLGDIPIINLLFKAKQRVKAKTELVILMKPVVIGEDTWQRTLEEQQTRIDALMGAD